MHIEDIIILARDKLLESGFIIERKQALAIVSLLVLVIIGSLIFYKTSQPKPVVVTKAGESRKEVSTKGALKPKKQEQLLVVHIAGAVVKPGVYQLKEGNRVVDAVKAAGGGLQNSDENALNLAAKVFDGQKIYVPEKGKTPPPSEMVQSGGTASGSDIKININGANLDQLDSLPGVGQVTARKIIEYREKRGFFKRIDELKEIDGIGDKKFDQLKDKLSVD